MIMKKRLVMILAMALSTIVAMAQSVKATWEFSDMNNLSACSITGDAAAVALTSGGYLLGGNLSPVSVLTSSGADTGYSSVQYSPAFTQLRPSTQVNSATNGHNIAVSVTPQSGHKFKPTKVSFDACKVGTDAGGIVVRIKESGGMETDLGTVLPARNKIMSGNSTGYSHHEFYVNDVLVDSKAFLLMIYVTNIAGADASSPKGMAFRNICIEGEIDGKLTSASDFVSGISFNGKTDASDAHKIDITSLVKDLKNGESARYATKLLAEPTDFNVVVADGYTADVKYADKTANVTIKQGGEQKFTFSVTFTVSTRPVKPTAKPLKRGLMSLVTSGGVLVSWRARATDEANYKFKLWRGSSSTVQTTKVNSGNFIAGKTNFLDASGNSSHYYKLEVFNENNELIETEVGRKTWTNQNFRIALGNGPTDPTTAGATYTPNDASFCDMDGDGEYEIVLKWSPSNEKDAASSGTTSPIFIDCVKMDGTRLWRMHSSQNQFTSAHTHQFIAWDFDGDGYGELMMKTGPGTVDGQGNYVLLGNDTPTMNLLSGRGKQDHGSEYITVFDGLTGAELATIPYHTAYADESTSFWGDSNQNRSERYLAAIAWLDGPDANPSPIFARGYYSGAKIGAYDWDGETLSLRWLHRAASASSGTVTYKNGTTKTLTSTVYGDGAHWISVGDCNGDGLQDIVYGSSALKHDGTTLYRTGMGHGDALHLGDFDPTHDGLEVYMSHEHSPYGADLRDAKTGKTYVRQTAGSDTGRGLIGHFNPEAEGAYFQHSASAAIYDWLGNEVNSSITHGGGASLNNRIYWNGNLSDEFFDKSVLEEWNVDSKTFWRVQVNGGNYVIGTLNNDSKKNPCVLGDLLGDWREEIVAWEGDAASGFNLVINATNYQTPYLVPHLMDDLNYRAQVINQNCCYNQPPHLSYNLRASKILTPETFEVEPSTEVGMTQGRYWGSAYTTYPVIVPEGVKVWAVGNKNNTDQTFATTEYKYNTIPADRVFIFNSNVPDPKFAPTSLASTGTISALYGKGSYCDSTLVDTSTRRYYEFRNGTEGLGIYCVNGGTVKGGKGWVQYTTSSTNIAGDYYLLGPAIQPVDVMVINEDEAEEDDNVFYTPQGIRLAAKPAHGVFIQKGRAYAK